MILYYAPENTLGQITRAIGIAHTLTIPMEDFVILTTYENMDFVGLFKNIITIPKRTLASKTKLKQFFLDTVLHISPDKIFIDTYPAGIIGELNDIKIDTELIHISRLLKWEKYFYKYCSKPPKYNRIYLIERLYDSHYDYLMSLYNKFTALSVNYPNIINIKKLNIPDKYWLVVSPKPKQQAEKLIKFAINLKKITNNHLPLVFISQTKIRLSNIIYLKLYGAWSLFENAEMIFTGAGFNSVNQLAKFASKAQILPFNTHYDDQFFRVKYFKFYTSLSNSI